MRGLTRTLLALLLLAPFAANAAEQPEQRAMQFDFDVLRRIPVQHNGRWMPLDTLARDTVESITGDMDYQGADAVYWLLDWTFNIERAQTEPLIHIGNAELRAELELPADKSRFSFRELLGHKPLQEQMDVLRSVQQQGQEKLDPLQSKVADIREKLLTLQGVFQNRVIRPVPDPNDSLGQWQPISEAGQMGAHSPHGGANDQVDSKLVATWEELGEAFKSGDADRFQSAAQSLAGQLDALPAAYRPSEKRIQMELHYNQLQPFRLAWMVMAVGALLSVAALVKPGPVTTALAWLGVLAGVAVLGYGLYLRGTIAGRLPAANMYESLLFLSLGMGVFAILSFALMHDRIVPLTASVMGALALFLATNLPMDGFIRPAPAVLLDTYWMSIHVPIIMISYSVLALAALIAHVQLGIMAFLPGNRPVIATATRLHYWYMHAGVILLGIGIVTGSMWAASSWGRYWGWDPKEVWSLIAFLGYLAILHIRVDRRPTPGWIRIVALLLTVGVFTILSVRLMPEGATMTAVGLIGALIAMAVFVLFRGPFAVAVKSILAFWMVIMTYVGVNYILGTGLHSYGFGSGAIVKYVTRISLADLLLVLVLTTVYLVRREAPATQTEESAAEVQTFPV